MILLCALLALACASLGAAYLRARRTLTALRYRAEAAELMHDATGREVNRLRERLRAAAPPPAAPAPTPTADFVALLYDQPLPPLVLKRPLAKGERRGGFAVRWGKA